MIKKTISLLTVVGLCFSVFFNYAKAQENAFNKIEFKIDSNAIQHIYNEKLINTYHAGIEARDGFAKYPVIIIEGRSYVSVDYFINSEMLTLFYTLEIYFDSVDKQVEMRLFPNNEHPSFVNHYISLKTGSDYVFIDNEEHYLDAPVPNTNKTNGIAYFPIRFIFETFGCKVDWNNDRRVVIIHLPQ